MFCFSMHSKSTPGLNGLNEFITEVSIHVQKQPYLRPRPPKEYRLYTRRTDFKSPQCCLASFTIIRFWGVKLLVSNMLQYMGVAIIL